MVNSLIAWLHAWLVVPIATWWEQSVLGTWEEVVMGVIRQTFQDCARFLNGLSSWLLSFFQRDYRETLRRSWEDNPWHSWWHHAQARPSTLNALIAAQQQQQQQQQQEQQQAGTESTLPPAPPSDWTSGLTSMFGGGGRPSMSTNGSGIQEEEQEEEQLGASAIQTQPLQPQRSFWRGWLGQPQQQQAHHQQQQQQQVQQQHRHPSWAANRRSASASPSMPVAAPPPDAPAPVPSLPPSTQRGSASGAAAAAASRPASMSGTPGRPVIFVQQSGMGILESLKRTGLLEDTRLAIELRVSQAFEWARRMLRAACRLPPPPSSPHAFTPATKQLAGAQPRLPAPPANASRHSAFGTMDAGVGADGAGKGPGGVHRGTEQMEFPGVLTSGGVFGQPQVATTPGAESRASPHLPPSWHEQLPRSHSAHVHMLDDMPLTTSLADPSPYSPRPSISNPSAPALPQQQQQRTRRRGADPSLNSVRSLGAPAPAPAPLPPNAGGVLKRSASFGAMESVCQHLSQVTSAGDVIRLAGYPLELHNVTTDDGYILRMERIPRPGSRDAVFFMHGVLDTSMAWVSAGVTGSQAFAAWDAGFDVWLGNSRCNAPRLHQDPRKASTRVAYWRYSCNELGTFDVAAQLERIHNVKCTELGGGQVDLELDHLGPLASRLLPDYTPPKKMSPHPNAITPTPSMGRSSVSSKASKGSEALTDAAPHPPKSASFPARPLEALEHSLLSEKNSRSHDKQRQPQQQQKQQQPQPQQQRRALRRISSHPLPIVSDLPPNEVDTVEGAGEGSTNPPPRRSPQESTSYESFGTSGLASTSSLPSSTSSLSPSPSLSPTPTPTPTPTPMCASHTHHPLPTASSPFEQYTDAQVAKGSGPSGAGQRAPSPANQAHTHSTSHPQAAAPADVPPHPSATGLPRPKPAAEGSHGSDSSSGKHREDTARVGDDVAGGGSQDRVGAQNGKAATPTHIAPEPSLHSWQSTLLSGISRGTGLEGLGHALAPMGAAVRRSGARTAAAAAGMMGRKSEEAAPKGQARPERTVREPEPYRLRAVGHSLGGMSLLIHAAMASSQGKPTRIHRLILFTPAGVHAQLPRVGHPIAFLLPPLVWLARLIWPSLAAPVYIPTTLARGLTFKLMADLRAIPSLAELLNLAIRGLLSGDASQWDRALQMPHYGAKAMPACSLNQCIHMAQIARTGKFRLFDWGNSKANMEAYGTPQPPDIVERYGSLADIPIDLVAGTRDGVIPPHNIRIHYEAMKAAGLQVSYREFDFGHLDFTFAVKEELKRFLLHSLRK